MTVELFMEVENRLFSGALPGPVINSCGHIGM